MFEFDFDKHFQEIGKETFISACEKMEKESKEDDNSFVIAITDIYFANLEASKRVLKEYHKQLMNYLDSKHDS